MVKIIVPGLESVLPQEGLDEIDASGRTLSIAILETGIDPRDRRLDLKQRVDFLIRKIKERHRIEVPSFKGVAHYDRDSCVTLEHEEISLDFLILANNVPPVFVSQLNPDERQRLLERTLKKSHFWFWHENFDNKLARI